MDIKKIKGLADLLKKYSLTELSYTEGESQITLKKEPAQQVSVAPVQNYTPPQTNVIAEEINEPVLSFGDVNEIKAPLVGVFYVAPSADSPPYVTIGSKVKKGETLCIVEAMKLMNEITADRDGEIIDICAVNGQIVEFGQTLFKVI